MTAPYPVRRVAHRVPPRLTDSVRGVKWARDHGYPWIDVNCLLSREGTAHAQHGAPYGLAQQGFLRAGDGRKVRDLTDEQLADLRSPDGYRIPTMHRIFMAACHTGLHVELEAKDDRRFTQVETWRRIAADAKAAWPRNWQAHVNVKVLTNLSGGLPYALAVCDAAHAAGFITIILPRRVARLRRIDGPSITYNHGGRV